MSSFSFDPIIKDIINKYLEETLKNNNNVLLKNYLYYIIDSLPKKEESIDIESIHLFLELIEILGIYRFKNTLVSNFLKNKIVKNLLIETIPFQNKYNQFKKKVLKQKKPKIVLTKDGKYIYDEQLIEYGE